VRHGFGGHAGGGSRLAGRHRGTCIGLRLVLAPRQHDHDVVDHDHDGTDEHHVVDLNALGKARRPR
jgi:hypothetical protein